MWLELAITSKVSKFESYAGWPLSGVGCSPFQPIQVLPQELLDCSSYPDSLYLTFLCLFLACKDNPRLNQFFYDLGIKHRNISFLFKTCFYPDCERVDILKFFKVDIGFSHPCRTKIWNLSLQFLSVIVKSEMRMVMSSWPQNAGAPLFSSVFEWEQAKKQKFIISTGLVWHGCQSVWWDYGNREAGATIRLSIIYEDKSNPKAGRRGWVGLVLHWLNQDRNFTNKVYQWHQSYLLCHQVCCRWVKLSCMSDWCCVSGARQHFLGGSKCWAVLNTIVKILAKIQYTICLTFLKHLLNIRQAKSWYG